MSTLININTRRYLNENDDFKRIVSAAKETADEQFYDDLVAEFNEGDDEAVHDYEEYARFLIFYYICQNWKWISVQF